VSEPQTLLRHNEAFAELTGAVAGSAETISNRHSQADVLCFVGSPNRFDKRIERFLKSPGKKPDAAEPVQHQAEDVTIPAPLGMLPSSSKQEGRLILDVAETSELIHDLASHGGFFDSVPRRLRDAVPLLRIELFSELHRALYVGEEHGHLLAFAFQRASRRENLLG
jgi:hypothetical protein